ncbi:hypothetical protein NW762_014753 [Fusarium torreyae]|uniref:Uncharacterized protein n=1 Tax=Fusarium torreyae TaxID=1237075 RepID=A0A9W8RLL1_9HYPO|nr:hypothetical protein NW762_014753 [Fusarium torreyae]
MASEIPPRSQFAVLEALLAKSPDSTMTLDSLTTPNKVPPNKPISKIDLPRFEVCCFCYCGMTGPMCACTGEGCTTGSELGIEIRDNVFLCKIVEFKEVPFNRSHLTITGGLNNGHLTITTLVHDINEYFRQQVAPGLKDIVLKHSENTAIWLCHTSSKCDDMAGLDGLFVTYDEAMERTVEILKASGLIG